MSFIAGSIVTVAMLFCFPTSAATGKRAGPVETCRRQREFAEQLLDKGKSSERKNCRVSKTLSFKKDRTVSFYSDCVTDKSVEIADDNASVENKYGAHKLCIVKNEGLDGKRSIRATREFPEGITEKVAHYFKREKDNKYIEEMTIHTGGGMLTCTRETDQNGIPKDATTYTWCGLGDSVNGFNYTDVKYPGEAHENFLIMGKITASKFFRQDDGKLKSGFAVAKQ